LGIEEGLVTDIFTSQDICGKIVLEYATMDEQLLEELTAEFKNPFIAQYIKDRNQRTIAAVAANKGKFEAVYKEMPAVEDDSLLFDAIMDKYKGKVVYVDFWATWCHPCRWGIKQIAPLKEEMIDDDVVFVYISAYSSPQETYKNMIPDIKGEHYKTSIEQWKYLCDQFAISGIPHYILVDKEGKVVKNNFRLHDNEAVKSLINEYL
jgi:thiol-disulfide isomerase/thioredoxin